MSPDSPDGTRERQFLAPVERKLPRRHRVARAAIVLCFAVLIIPNLWYPGTDSCIAAAACAVVALIAGSRRQRLLSAGLLGFASAAFIYLDRAFARRFPAAERGWPFFSGERPRGDQN